MYIDIVCAVTAYNRLHNGKFRYLLKLLLILRHKLQNKLTPAIATVHFCQVVIILNYMGPYRLKMRDFSGFTETTSQTAVPSFMAMDCNHL